MFIDIFNWVMDGLMIEDEEDEEDGVMVIISALIALSVTVVAFVFLLPVALGDEREAARRRFWRFKWIYVIYLGIGVGLYAFLAMNLGSMSSALVGGTLPALYFGSVLVMRRKGVSSVDLIPGGEKLVQTAQPAGDDEFEVSMRVDDKSANAGRVPVLRQDESTLAVGASRSGKTSALKLLACQINYESKAVVAHGSMGEYSQFYRSRLDTEVIEIGVHSSSHHWNLFREIEEDREFDNLARSLFNERDRDYFETAGRQVFSAVLKLLDREKDNPDHRDIKELFERSTAEETYTKLCEHPDLRSAAEHLDPDAKEQQRGVWSSVVQRVNDVFVGDFAESGQFSFREYVQNPDEKVVVVESPEVSRGVGPMYQLMLDEGIEKAMQSRRECFMLLDELDTLPAMDNIGDLAARGLAQDVRMLLGIQTIGQLHDVYGVDGSKAVTGNCNQVICLSPGNDEGDSVKFYKSLLGQRRETVKGRSRSREKGTSVGGNVRTSVSEQEQDRYPVTEHDMNSWERGEGLVVRRDRWWLGKLDYYERVFDRYANTEIGE